MKLAALIFSAFASAAAFVPASACDDLSSPFRLLPTQERGTTLHSAPSGR